jgi:hypothetical protein
MKKIFTTLAVLVITSFTYSMQNSFVTSPTDSLISANSVETDNSSVATDMSEEEFSPDNTQHASPEAHTYSSIEGIRGPLAILFDSDKKSDKLEESESPNSFESNLDPIKQPDFDEKLVQVKSEVDYLQPLLQDKKDDENQSCCLIM